MVSQSVLCPLLLSISVLDFGRDGYRGGLCEKLPGSSSMSDRVNASWLQDRPVPGQGQVNQQQQMHLGGSILKNEKTGCSEEEIVAREE